MQYLPLLDDLPAKHALDELASLIMVGGVWEHPAHTLTPSQALSVTHASSHQHGTVTIASRCISVATVWPPSPVQTECNAVVYRLCVRVLVEVSSLGRPLTALP